MRLGGSRGFGKEERMYRFYVSFQRWTTFDRRTVDDDR